LSRSGHRPGCGRTAAQRIDRPSRTTLTGDGVTWELDLAKTPDLAERVASLNRKSVVVEGTLKMVKGTDIRTRWIVIVERIRAAESP